MAKFEITISGCGAPNPTLRHMTTCQVVNYKDKLYMLDCGEAAQWSMQKFDMKFSRLQAVFISHLHGDHYLGLPGLLLIALYALSHTILTHTHSTVALMQIINDG